MNTIIPIASGKGGVGKTLFTANFAITLAKMGKTVLMVDLDLGGSNLHTVLGIKNSNSGIGSYIYKHETSLESLIIETQIPRLYFIPGDGLYPGTANIPYFTKEKLLKELRKLVADYIFLDLGAGSSFNTVDFFISSGASILVSTPEPTSLLNSYGFLKSALFRKLYRSFPSKSGERELVKELMAMRLEGSPLKIASLIDSLKEISPESSKKVQEILGSFFPRVIINQVRNQSTLPMGLKLRDISRQNLNIEMEYLGWLAWQDDMSNSIMKRTPYCISQPGSDYSRSLQFMAEKLAHSHFPSIPTLHPTDDELLNYSPEKR